MKGLLMSVAIPRSASSGRVPPPCVKMKLILGLRVKVPLYKRLVMARVVSNGNSMVESDVVNSSINGFVRGFQFEPNPHYMSDGTVEIEVTLPIDGANGFGQTLFGGQVNMVLTGYATVASLIKGGKLKVLAVTGKDRFPAVPDVPTVMESGVIPNYDVTTWYGFFAPKGTPRPIVDKLNKVLNEVLAEDTIKERLTKAGVVVKGSTPDEWRQFMIAEYKKWSSVREKAGIEQR